MEESGAESSGVELNTAICRRRVIRVDSHLSTQTARREVWLGEERHSLDVREMEDHAAA